MRIDYNDYSLIPERMMQSLKNYIEKGERVGGFLTSVLSNDLWRAVGSADDINKPLIPTYVHYLHWESPAECHGSPEHVKAWYEKKDKEKQATTTAQTEE